MDYKAILNLMKEMNQTELTKLEIEQDGIKICLEKAAPVAATAQPVINQPAFTPGFLQAQAIQPQVFAQPQPAVSVAVTQTNNESIEKPAEDLSGKKLVSPMVGTFYAASAPDKPPFVKVGDKVKKGQTICIIEAMKLMNEIEAEQDGEVVKILANNEQMVEFGQPLFLIK